MYEEIRSINPTEFKKIIFWFLAWILVAAVSNLGLIANGYTYSNNPKVISLYFISFSLLGFYYWNLKEKFSHLAGYKIQGFFVLIFFCISLLITLIVKELIPLNFEILNKIQKNKLELPQFTLNFMISKFAEIIFQQTYILALLKILKSNSENDSKTIKIFTLFFTLIHIPLLIVLKWQAFYFIIPSFFAGFIFSYLLLKFHFGILYSYVVHISFYLILGTYLRLNF